MPSIYVMWRLPSIEIYLHTIICTLYITLYSYLVCMLAFVYLSSVKPNKDNHQDMIKRKTTILSQYSKIKSINRFNWDFVYRKRKRKRKTSVILKTFRRICFSDVLLITCYVEKKQKKQIQILSTQNNFISIKNNPDNISLDVIAFQFYYYKHSNEPDCSP